jgi:G3E family GTPase
VVDAVSFLADWQSEEDLRARELSLGDEDERSIADLLVEQVEFANVLVLSKLDLVTGEDADRLAAMLMHLNPQARIVRAKHGQVPLECVLETGLFDFEKAAQAPGWLQELRGEHVPESIEYGLSSFVYRSRTPFHPARLWSLLQDADAWHGVLRSKGFLWLASRMEVTGLWSQAGATASCEAAGIWYAALPRAEWPEDEEARQQIEADWQEPWETAGKSWCSSASISTSRSFALAWTQRYSVPKRSPWDLNIGRSSRIRLRPGKTATRQREGQSHSVSMNQCSSRRKIAAAKRRPRLLACDDEEHAQDCRHVREDPPPAR